jgi:hypothetical protein
MSVSVTLPSGACVVDTTSTISCAAHAANEA